MPQRVGPRWNRNGPEEDISRVGVLCHESVILMVIYQSQVFKVTLVAGFAVCCRRCCCGKVFSGIAFAIVVSSTRRIRESSPRAILISPFQDQTTTIGPPPWVAEPESSKRIHHTCPGPPALERVVGDLMRPERVDFFNKLIECWAWCSKIAKRNPCFADVEVRWRLATQDFFR